MSLTVTTTTNNGRRRHIIAGGSLDDRKAMAFDLSHAEDAMFLRASVCRDAGTITVDVMTTMEDGA